MTAIVVLDTETTGKDRARDQIVELCLQLGLTGAECRGWRIRPTAPIHPEATAVHGIRAEDLAACRTFPELADEIVAYLNAADVIIGFNVRFDLDMIQADLQRAGMPPLDLTVKTLVDAMRLWQHFEPRTLGAAHEKFIGLPLTNAHAASADVAATAVVLEAMLDRFGLAGQDWSAIAAVSDPLPERHSWVGPSHHLKWKDGHVAIAFGKYAGVLIEHADSGFLLWVMRNDFPPHVKEVCQAAMGKRPEAFATWLREKFPRRAVAA